MEAVVVSPASLPVSGPMNGGIIRGGSCRSKCMGPVCVGVGVRVGTYERVSVCLGS